MTGALVVTFTLKHDADGVESKAQNQVRATIKSV
jgi:hypothetical protein